MFLMTNIPDFTMNLINMEHSQVYDNSESEKKQKLFKSVKRKLHKLTRKQRMDVDLMLRGYKLKQIAHIRGISWRCVQHNIKRAVKSLQKALIPEYGKCKKCGKKINVTPGRNGKKKKFCNSDCNWRYHHTVKEARYDKERKNKKS